MRGLIDETEIYNSKIRKVEVKKLEENEKVKKYIGTGIKTYLEDYLTGEEIFFDTLEIEDKYMFDTLQIGSKSNEGFRHEFLHISMFVSDLEGEGHNLKPLSKSEYEARCEKVRNYIEKQYGLDLNLDEKKFKLLALNKTFEVEDEVEEYWELFELIWLVAPGKYKSKGFIVSGNNEIIGVYLENGLIKIKIYNKTRQLKIEKGIELDKQYMRAEVVLKDVRKIKEIFGTTLVADISDEQMKEFYEQIMKEDIFDKVEEYLEGASKQLQKIAKEEKKRNKLNWTRNFFLKAGQGGLKYKKRSKATKIDLLFDIEQCLEIIKIETKSNYKKRLKTLEKDIKDLDSKKNNLVKYNEIKNKILD